MLDTCSTRGWSSDKDNLSRKVCRYDNYHGLEVLAAASGTQVYKPSCN